MTGNESDAQLETATEQAECVFCELPVTPRNDRVARHICRECLAASQVADRVEGR